MILFQISLDQSVLIIIVIDPFFIFDEVSILIIAIVCLSVFRGCDFSILIKRIDNIAIMDFIGSHTDSIIVWTDRKSWTLNSISVVRSSCIGISIFSTIMVSISSIPIIVFRFLWFRISVSIIIIIRIRSHRLIRLTLGITIRFLMEPIQNSNPHDIIILV